MAMNESAYAAPGRGNWFDSFTKAAALGRISRRTVVGGVLGLAGANAGGVSLAERAGAARLTPARLGECRRAGLHGPIKEEALVVEGDLELRTIREVMLGEHSRVLLTRTLNQRGKLFYELEIDAQSECDFFFTLRLGKEIAGAQKIILQGRADRGMRGEVDGRVFGLPPGATSIDEAHFVDGRPWPRLALPDGASLKEAARKIGASESRALAGCAGLEESVVPQTREQPVQTFMTMSDNSIVVREKSPSNWSPPFAHEPPGCTRCYNRCGDRYKDCLPDIWDVLVNPVGAAATTAFCLAKYGFCMGNCRLPGQGCCPVLCGDIFTGSCCGEGKKCLGTYGCCEVGQIVCGTSCCNPGVTHCGADGYCGCPDPYRECGRDACYNPQIQVCCEGRVCPPGFTCHDGSCCRGRVCEDGTCCDLLGSTCCGRTCCMGQCINHSCCPQERVCGSACCAPGQECLDRGRSICGTLATPDCGRPPFSIQRPCRSNLNDGRLVSICCQYGLDCCNGQCCGFGEICCWYNNRCQPSRYVCGPN